MIIDLRKFFAYHLTSKENIEDEIAAFDEKTGAVIDEHLAHWQDVNDYIMSMWSFSLANNPFHTSKSRE